MERNHIIGFVLIFGLLMVWTFVNSPSKEELEKSKRTQDSLRQLEIVKDSIQSTVVDSSDKANVVDSAIIANKYGSFATAVTAVPRQNDAVHRSQQDRDFETALILPAMRVSRSGS